MTTLNDLHYKEYSMSWAMEVISESFDNAECLMTENALIYGGAVRDVIAGMDLLGDLDIIVPAQEYLEILKSFNSSPNWVAAEISTSKKNAYSKMSPISEISEFRTHNKRTAQLVVTNGEIKDPAKAALSIVRRVDIVCCGLAMTRGGKIIEVIPEAFENAKNRVLKLSRIDHTIDMESLVRRIKKLEDRGWKNAININQTKRLIAKAIKKHEKDLKSIDINEYYEDGKMKFNIIINNLINNNTNLKNEIFNRGCSIISGKNNPRLVVNVAEGSAAFVVESDIVALVGLCDDVKRGLYNGDLSMDYLRDRILKNLKHKTSSLISNRIKK